MGKKLGRYGVLACLFILCGFAVMKCDAKEENGEEILVTLMVTQNKTEVLEEKDEIGKVITALEAGTTVLCCEEEKDGWIRILYQDYEGYVRAENLIAYGSRDELEKEFSVLDTYFENGFERIGEMQKQRVQSIIWAAVIVLLLAASIVLGTASVIKNKGKREKRNEEEYFTNAGNDG